MKRDNYFGKLFGSYDTAILPIGTYPTEIKIFGHKDFHRSVLCSFIRKSKKLGIPQMTINERMNKRIMIYSYLEIHSEITRYELLLT